MASSLSKFFLRLCVSTVEHGKSLLIAAVAFGWSWVVGVRTPRISRARRAAGVLLLAAGLYSARSFARSLPWRLLGLGGTRRKQLPPAAPEPEPEPQQIASAQRQALDDLHAAATAAAAAGRRAKQGPMRMAEVIDAIRAEISTPSDADAEQNLTAKVRKSCLQTLFKAESMCAQEVVALAVEEYGIEVEESTTLKEKVQQVAEQLGIETRW